MKKVSEPFDLPGALLNTFAINDRINRFLISGLDPAAWSAEAPNGKGRTIPAILAHMHNVRLMWLKAAGSPDESIPKLDPAGLKQNEAIEALAKSQAALRTLLDAALHGDGKIKGFKPDAAGFIGYLIAHDAHHRGQISMLARQSGHAVPPKIMFGMWEWNSR